MDLSLTLNAELSTLGEFLTILQRWERSASLEERVTMMEELTLCFSSNLKRSEDSGVHIFDVDGYHPNVVPGYSNPRKGWEYATKDGDIVCGGLGCPSDGSDIEGKTDSKWAVIVASPDADTFWENVKSLGSESVMPQLLPAYRPTPATVIGLIEIHTSTQESYWSIVGSILSFKNGGQ